MADTTHIPGPAGPSSPSSGPNGQDDKSHSGLWLIAGLLLLAGVAGFVIWKHHGAAPAEAPGARGGRGGAGLGPTMVSVARAQEGDINVYVNGLGSVVPLNMVAVNSRVQGQIMKVYYQEGQMVKAGDPLVDIDPRPSQASLTQAEGQLARDQALLEDARLDLQRYQSAFESNAIPKQQLDTQTALVHQDEGTVELDRGLVDSARVQLDYCHLTAPIAGRTGLRLVDVGNIVQAGSSNLVVISQLQPISVIFNVAEDDLPAIQKQLRDGNHLEVDAFDHSLQNKLASGQLQTLDNQIDPNTGTLKLRAIFTNADESLYPNQFVNARLRVDTLEDVTLLPNAVIQRNSDTAYVFLLEPDATGTNQVAHMQTITTGPTDGNVTAVDGIDPETVVVADNFNKLTDGAKVIVRPAAGGGRRGKKPPSP